MKAPEDMSGPELQKAYDRSLAKRSALGERMIAAGRGYEKPSETRTKTDPLANEIKEENERFDSLRREMDRRKTYHGTLRPIQRSKWV